MGEKVLIAMSGGVDSAVTALLLKEAGFQPTGVTFRMLTKEEGSTPQLSEKGISDAAAVADSLDMEHYVVDVSNDFKMEVISYFADSYMKGHTPNPCIQCNRRVKFAELLRQAEALGFSHISTGHYARVLQDEKSGRFLLYKGKDLSKDQSYVLYALTQEILLKLILPLGNLTKAEVRKLASDNGFINADRPESQDICFVPDGDYAAFLAQSCGLTAAPGNFVSETGEILGRHKGIIGYTVGQRRGLGVSSDRPLYVISKDAVKNEIVLAGEEKLYKKRISVCDVSYISSEDFETPIRAEVKIRYSQNTAPAMIIPTGKKSANIEFDLPQRAPAAGQAAVFYDGELVLGGGIIA